MTVGSGLEPDLLTLRAFSPRGQRRCRRSRAWC